ncbi:Sec-independent protein translocase protein TatB [Haemophilus parahaemolyticus]|uniref:Sec-independent protein translocase protein TatB n=1 Tax=Haemophilus parahaemolyticus TaxID=735 RepID=A0A369ZBR0_HAEPH|nr:Sec-independent protein translocase protein TatB [Haemophilus parahaemolyticus]MDQ6575688.1 Sec-independent protein translocase protein TatB [Haemophilus parahaemolyticus]RDF01230.1 Sec-independent protein translocase subunit TatB [Haemophilus parahaemolyticus]
MFDIGFSELVLVLIVGLVVLGPQRLPIAIRTVMGWVRTIRGLAANVQNELAQELKLQELKESIKKAEELNLSSLSPELSKTVEELKQSAQQMQQDLNTTKGEITKLTDEQVAEIQAKIEAESKPKEAEQAVENNQQNAKEQNAEENSPLVSEEKTVTTEEDAEQAELDEALLAEKLSIYYPPDDDDVAPQALQKDKEKENARS